MDEDQETVPFEAAVGRLRAARLSDAGVAEPPRPFVAGVRAEPPRPVVVEDRVHREEPADGADELRARLADRRDATAAARQAAAAYAALQGHVPGEEELASPSGRRWVLRPRLAIVAVIAVLVVGVGLAVAAGRPHAGVEPLGAVAAPSGAGSAPVPSDSAPPSEAPRPSPSGPGVVVDVVGQVRKPGLITLPAGSRVADAVAAAGGAADGADLGAVNLARPVVDGEQLRVPAPGEAPAPAAAAGPATAAQPGPGGLVNLNTADAATLDTLPGVGPAIAARIVAWREQNGAFASVDELDEVAGIGPAMLAKLHDLVTV
ncbi:MAG: ComEA family DNA-binding protein [Promicromonosporaceae bacterium]|nr:ComEA family DNA-binding protein [Promicromonosporaceae bacterium]